MRASIRDLCLISMLAALLAAAALVPPIPLPGGIPMTLQTLAVPLAGLLLGPKRGALAVLVYLLLGAVGAPVFSGGGAGLGVLFGKTGGFLLSFPLMALLAGLWAERGVWGISAGLALGTAVNFLCGAVVFRLVMGAPWPVVVAACVTPFLIPAVIKGLAAGFLGLTLRPLLARFIEPGV